MAISKRLRFEVMRRDEFRCYYCGTRGNETGSGLTIDHVVPVALGGTDDPENLVSACGDCNSGKTSTTADAALIAEVDQATAIAKAARALAVDAIEGDLAAEAEFRADVWDGWGDYAPSYMREPDDLDRYIDAWFKEGVPMLAILKAFRVAWDNRDVPKSSKVAYAGGVIRNIMRDAEDRSRALAAGDDAIFNRGYDSGFHDGQMFAETVHDGHDLVALHIDGRHDADWYSLMASEKYLPWRSSRGA